MNFGKPLQLKATPFNSTMTLTKINTLSLSNSTLNTYKALENAFQNDDNVIDEREQKIVDFLDAIGIEFKSPLDKYYDYCENLRKESNSGSNSSSLSIKSKLSCDSLNDEENSSFTLSSNKKTLILSSTLYKKRKFSALQK